MPLGPPAEVKKSGRQSHAILMAAPKRAKTYELEVFARDAKEFAGRPGKDCGGGGVIGVLRNILSDNGVIVASKVVLLPYLGILEGNQYHSDS